MKEHYSPAPCPPPTSSCSDDCSWNLGNPNSRFLTYFKSFNMLKPRGSVLIWILLTCNKFILADVDFYPFLSTLILDDIVSPPPFISNYRISSSMTKLLSRLIFNSPLLNTDVDLNNNNVIQADVDLLPTQNNFILADVDLHHSLKWYTSWLHFLPTHNKMLSKLFWSLPHSPKFYQGWFFSLSHSLQCYHRTQCYPGLC